MQNTITKHKKLTLILTEKQTYHVNFKHAEKSIDSV